MNTRELQAEVTRQIVAAIEANPGRPEMPWRRASGASFLPSNIASRRTYQGINTVCLWAVAQTRGYSVSVWGTYKQWLEAGCQVRRGEKSATVIFYKDFEVEPDPEDADDDGKRRVMRGSAVFNAAQVDGYVPPEPSVLLGPVERIERADALTRGNGADIRHGGDQAHYVPSEDYIQVPDEGLFTGTRSMTRSEGYYAVLLHELIHWTGAAHRLKREMGKKFGSMGYAAEELVAEIGAAFLCAELGITQAVKPDHAAYVATWLKVLKSDPQAIFSAAARATEAANWLRKQISRGN